MDNNFEEKNINEESEAVEATEQSEAAEQPAEEIAPDNPQPELISAPPQDMPPVPPVPEKKKRQLSWGCFWALVSTIAVLFAIIVVLVVLIAKASAKLSSSDNFFNSVINAPAAEHIVIELPTVEKPVLEEEFYANKETGLLTPVGVAKTILPSQVQIKAFNEVPYAPISTGSGIIVTADGYIATNAHVVDGATNYAVVFHDGTEAEAVIIGMDKKSDLAVIKVDKEGLTPAQFGTSSNLVIGEAVALAGAGAGFENTVTYGYVTGLGREINTDYIHSSAIMCIQSDAALNPGNSGGALVNMYGQVVGIAVAIMDHETYENIGFSIAVDDAVPIIEDLIAVGYVKTRTKVGISYVTVGDTLASSYGIESGLCVTEIDPTCNVASSGIKLYDIITEMDGQKVFSAEEISKILSEKVPGDTLNLTVYRKPVAGDGFEFTVDIILETDTNSTSGYSSKITEGEEEPKDPFVIE